MFVDPPAEDCWRPLHLQDHASWLSEPRPGSVDLAEVDGKKEKMPLFLEEDVSDVAMNVLIFSRISRIVGHVTFDDTEMMVMMNHRIWWPMFTESQDFSE